VPGFRGQSQVFRMREALFQRSLDEAVAFDFQSVLGLKE
jgi:hypothetical protein